MIQVKNFIRELVLVVMCVLGVATLQPAFADIAVGTEPYALAVGDFNGDGKQDLVVANWGSANISVLLGTGTGSFGAATNFAVGSLPQAFAITDFNGDGKQDLAVTNFGSTNISVLLGTGTGSFGAATNFAVGVNPEFVDFGDFNGDGKHDLAVTNGNSDNVSVLLGNGDGTFGSATNFAVGTNPYSIIVRDFNGDGKPDLAISNQGSDNVSILLGNGGGTFGSATNFAVGDRPLGMVIGDFNGDGKHDLAVSNGESDNVSVLLGNGNGTFGSATNFAVGGNPSSVAVLDFNGDGKQDLAVAKSNRDNVLILLGNGGGAFSSGETFVVGDRPYYVTVGDFDGDGKQELVTANRNSNDVSVVVLNRNDDVFRGAAFLGNISTRARVLTGDNAMIGGFIIDGLAPLRVLVRSRGPSMGGAPFFVPGILANPFVRLFSGQTVIAQNDNWQDTPNCSGFVCEGPAQIMDAGLDPCQPNPGQAGSPPNCNLESAILITLPPGAYTAIVTGSDGGTGVGLVEVFEADASIESELSNISTRGFVQSGDNIMIGGLIIEGSAESTVLVRARGPSMAGAPFFVPGTLANPFLRLFSGQDVIAQNDNWQDTPSCGGFACGGAAQIVATGLDPCQPNPGQSTSPPDCAQESAILITLPPGAYTAFVSGADGGTGVGLVEVFEMD